jgi:hypothetical protein
MKLAFRALLLAAVFAGVGLVTAHTVLSHAVARHGTAAPETRLAAMMAGLFAGGAATVIAGIALALSRRKS